MDRRERLVLCICMAILMGISFSVSLHDIGMGICLGICMAGAFGVFWSEERDDNE